MLLWLLLLLLLGSRRRRGRPAGDRLPPAAVAPLQGKERRRPRGVGRRRQLRGRRYWRRWWHRHRLLLRLLLRWGLLRERGHGPPRHGRRQRLVVCQGRALGYQVGLPRSLRRRGHRPVGGDPHRPFRLAADERRLCERGPRRGAIQAPDHAPARRVAAVVLAVAAGGTDAATVPRLLPVPVVARGVVDRLALLWVVCREGYGTWTICQSIQVIDRPTHSRITQIDRSIGRLPRSAASRTGTVAAGPRRAQAGWRAWGRGRSRPRTGAPSPASSPAKPPTRRSPRCSRGSRSGRGAPWACCCCYCCPRRRSCWRHRRQQPQERRAPPPPRPEPRVRTRASGPVAEAAGAVGLRRTKAARLGRRLGVWVGSDRVGAAPAARLMMKYVWIDLAASVCCLESSAGVRSRRPIPAGPKPADRYSGRPNPVVG